MQINFDATVIDISDKRGDFEPMPQGKYNAMITKNEIVSTQAGGQMLVLHCKVLEGQYVNRMVFWNLNIQNSNPKAVEIANEHLAILLSNLGLPAPSQHFETDTLMGIPFVMGVKIRPAQGDWAAKNDVSFTGPALNQPPTAPMMGRPTPPPTAAPSAAPWA